MKVIIIDNEKKSVEDYKDAIRREDEAAVVRSFHVDDAYKHIVLEEISHLNFPVLVENKRIHVKSFGQFEVYIDGIPVTSKYNKTRELFAFLVDKNGALASIHEIQASLWEDGKDHISYLKNLRSDMIATLRESGVEDVLVRQHGRIGIIPDFIECDYYDMLKGKVSAINLYNGEYMSQYSWAEYTNAVLMDIKEEFMMHNDKE